MFRGGKERRGNNRLSMDFVVCKCCNPDIDRLICLMNEEWLTYGQIPWSNNPGNIFFSQSPMKRDGNYVESQPRNSKCQVSLKEQNHSVHRHRVLSFLCVNAASYESQCVISLIYHTDCTGGKWRVFPNLKRCLSEQHWIEMNCQARAINAGPQRSVPSPWLELVWRGLNGSHMVPGGEVGKGRGLSLAAHQLQDATGHKFRLNAFPGAAPLFLLKVRIYLDALAKMKSNLARGLFWPLICLDFVNWKSS